MRQAARRARVLRSCAITLSKKIGRARARSLAKKGEKINRPPHSRGAQRDRRAIDERPPAATQKAAPLFEKFFKEKSRAREEARRRIMRGAGAARVSIARLTRGVRMQSARPPGRPPETLVRARSSRVRRRRRGTRERPRGLIPPRKQSHLRGRARISATYLPTNPATHPPSYLSRPAIHARARSQ